MLFVVVVAVVIVVVDAVVVVVDVDVVMWLFARSWGRKAGGREGSEL